MLRPKRVNGTELLCQSGESNKKSRNRNLVRDRHVTRHAGGLKPPKHMRHFNSVHTECHIDGVQSQGGKSRIVHHRRERVLDGPTTTRSRLRPLCSTLWCALLPHPLERCADQLIQLFVGAPIHLEIASKRVPYLRIVPRDTGVLAKHVGSIYSTQLLHSHAVMP